MKWVSAFRYLPINYTVSVAEVEEYPKDWLPAIEEVRLAVNRRIREGIGYDGYFDYDAAVRDLSRDGYMKQEYHIGDGVHPNDAGGAAMARQAWQIWQM